MVYLLALAVSLNLTLWSRRQPRHP